MFWKRKKRDDGHKFWAWLAANTARIQAAGPEGVTEFVPQIAHAFEKSYPDLVFEISPSTSGPWIFCVSADGNLELFDQVKSAVASVGAIPGWEVKPFRQRGSLDAAITMNDRTLGYDDIWCEVEPDGARARVRLLVSGLTLDSAETLLGAALVLLDNAVGEHDSVVKIADLDNGPLPTNPTKSQTFFPLSELPGYLDGLTTGPARDA